MPLTALLSTVPVPCLLDDEARKEVVETIQFKLQYHKDKERAKQVKKLRDGKKNASVQ